MSKEYSFVFLGTKEDFFKTFNHSLDKPRSYYYIDQYLIVAGEDEIRFGVERAGHSGGYWFIPTITETDEGIELKGKMQYSGPQNDQSKMEMIIDNIWLGILYVVLLPVWLIVGIYSLVETLIRKIRKLPKIRNKEEKLFDLMENRLGCIRR